MTSEGLEFCLEGMEGEPQADFSKENIVSRPLRLLWLRITFSSSILSPLAGLTSGASRDPS